MASITLQAQVDDQGQLSLQLPESFQGAIVTVEVQTHPSLSIDALDETAGSIPDLVRPLQSDVIELWQQEEAWIQAHAKSSVSGGRDWTREMLYDRHCHETDP